MSTKPFVGVSLLIEKKRRRRRRKQKVKEKKRNPSSRSNGNPPNVTPLNMCLVHRAVSHDSCHSSRQRPGYIHSALIASILPTPTRHRLLPFPLDATCAAAPHGMACKQSGRLLSVSVRTTQGNGTCRKPTWPSLPHHACLTACSPIRYDTNAPFHS
ncbi:hypothetical protein LX36DRAFT_182294 [Colletotrichum falcatum]|nr:hypothetical protein LX36DRAFT_182294 [Colletotrichum falcatum]